MDKHFLVRREGKIEGPFEEQFLINMAKQGKLLPTDELAESQDGPWEMAKMHPVVIAAKPKKKNTIKVDEYKILTRKASEGYYEIRYWCPKCSTTIIIDEEEALKDYRCPACGIPTTIVDEAFDEIAVHRNDRRLEVENRQLRLLEEQRLAEQRRVTNGGRSWKLRYILNLLFAMAGLAVGSYTTTIYYKLFSGGEKTVSTQSDPEPPKNSQLAESGRNMSKESEVIPLRRKESAEQFFRRQANEGYEAARASGHPTLMGAFDPTRAAQEESGFLPGETTEEFFERQAEIGRRHMKEFRGN